MKEEAANATLNPLEDTLNPMLGADLSPCFNAEKQSNQEPEFTLAEQIVQVNNALQTVISVYDSQNGNFVTLHEAEGVRSQKIA